MPFQSDTTMHDGYLRVTSRGTLATVEEVEQYVDYLRCEALKHNTKRVLIDERKLMDQQDTLDAYDVSESNSTSLTALAGIKISCVCHPENYDLNKTYETFFLNRSLIFRVFLAEKEAIDWLVS